MRPLLRNVLAPLLGVVLLVGCAGPRWSRVSPYDRFILLMRACTSGDVWAVEILLDNGADPSGVKDWASDLSKPHGDGFSSPLSCAARGGHRDVMHLLVSRGAEVDALEGEGLTALAIAISHRQKESVRYLLSVGADPTLRFMPSVLSRCDDPAIQTIMAQAIAARKAGPSKSPEKSSNKPVSASTPVFSPQRGIKRGHVLTLDGTDPSARSSNDLVKI